MDERREKNSKQIKLREEKKRERQACEERDPSSSTSLPLLPPPLLGRGSFLDILPAGVRCHIIISHPSIDCVCEANWIEVHPIFLRHLTCI